MDTNLEKLYVYNSFKINENDNPQKMGKTHKITININKYPQCHCNQIHTNKIPFNSPLCHTVNLKCLWLWIWEWHRISLESCRLSQVCLQPRGLQEATCKPRKAPFLNSHLAIPLFLNVTPVNSKPWEDPEKKYGRLQRSFVQNWGSFRSMVSHHKLDAPAVETQPLP